jgi:nitroreductase
VIEPILGRRSLRAFDREPPGEGEMWTLFEAASLAPSSGNAQPWRFVIARRGSAACSALGDTLRPSNRWALAAPMLVTTAVRSMHEHPTKPPKENRLALLELGLAIGNVLIQAAALGLIAHPVGGFDRDAAREAMGIPSEWQLGVLLAIGRPGDPERLEPDVRARDPRPRERLGVSEMVFERHWGRPAYDSSKP